MASFRSRHPCRAPLSACPANDAVYLLSPRPSAVIHSLINHTIIQVSVYSQACVAIWSITCALSYRFTAFSCGYTGNPPTLMIKQS